MVSDNFILTVLKPGLLKRDRFGNILDARSTVTLIQNNGYNIVVDTGLQSEEKLIISSLDKLDLAPRDIDYVIITHDHIDHTGNNGLFANATIVMHKNELYNDIEGTKYRLISGEFEIIPGIQLLETFGHTNGCVSVFLSKRSLVSVFEITGLCWFGQEGVDLRGVRGGTAEQPGGSVCQQGRLLRPTGG